MFEIKNIKQLVFDYKLLEIKGLPQGEDFEKNIGILKQKLAFELRKPVALQVKDGKYFIAIPFNSENPELEQQLVPHIITLIPENIRYPLKLENSTSNEISIIVSFLEYQIKSTLWNNSNLWQPLPGKTYYWKNPKNVDEPNREIDIFGGFSYNVIICNQRAFFSLDLATKYLDRKFLTEYLDNSSIHRFLHKNFIYQYGERWYQITLSGDPKRSIKEHKFVDKKTNETIDVYTYIQKNVQSKTDLIKNLDPNSPAILYYQKGKATNMSAAAALCKRIYNTEDPRIKPLHYRSIQNPTQRFNEIITDIKTIFRNSRYLDIPLEISEKPLAIQTVNFQIPDQLFGNGYLIHTKKQNEVNGISINNLGKERLNALQTPNIRIYSDFPFDPQYLFVPSTLPRVISDDFKDQITQTIQKFSKYQYTPQRIVYDCSKAKSLKTQIDSIKNSIGTNSIKRGYVLLVLPNNADVNLHNFLKKELWPNYQFQCAMAHKLSSYYEEYHEGGETKFRVKNYTQHNYQSYLRNIALGMLIVNHKWPWVLEKSLNYDAHIGIDVSNSIAGVSFIYNDAKKCVFRSYPSRRKEKLQSSHIKTIVYEGIKDDIVNSNLTLKSIVLQRDGKIFLEERKGFEEAIAKLKHENIIDKDAKSCIVEIRKKTSKGIRIVSSDDSGKFENPIVGTYFILGSDEAFICTTGVPFLSQGTVRPLYVVKTSDDLDLTKISEDIFSLSQLIWAAPDRCGRLPIAIKLIDDFLKPISSESDEDEARYGD